MKPELFLFTNIFRDQMDRYGEIYTTYKMIVDGAAKSPDATIISNGDSPIFNSVENNQLSPILWVWSWSSTMNKWLIIILMVCSGPGLSLFTHDDHAQIENTIVQPGLLNVLNLIIV